MPVALWMTISASPPVAERIGVDTFHFIKSQLVYLVPAVLVLVSVRSGWLVGSASDSTGIGRPGKVHPRLQDHDLLNYDKPLEELIGASEEVNEAVSILIEKSKCRLSVLLRGQVVKQYPVVFGDNVEDDKFMRGDGRVPEGRFRILKEESSSAGVRRIKAVLEK